MTQNLQPGRELDVLLIDFSFSVDFRVSVFGCARCGKDHPGLAFKKIGTPVSDPNGDFTHWALCPDTTDPILLRIEEKTQER